MMEFIMRLLLSEPAPVHNAADASTEALPEHAMDWLQDSQPTIRLIPPKESTVGPIPIQQSSHPVSTGWPQGPILTSHVVHDDPTMSWFEHGGCSPDTVGYFSGSASSFGSLSPAIESLTDQYEHVHGISDDFSLTDAALNTESHRPSSLCLSPLDQSLLEGHPGWMATPSTPIHQRQASYASSVMSQDTSDMSSMPCTDTEYTSTPSTTYMIPGSTVFPFDLVPPSNASPEMPPVCSDLPSFEQAIAQPTSPLMYPFMCWPPGWSMESPPSNIPVTTPKLLPETSRSPSLPPGERDNKPSPKRRIHYCPYCSYTSDRSNNMKQHILTHMSDRPKPHKCPICPKAFGRKHDMKRHVRTHERRFHHFISSVTFPTTSYPTGPVLTVLPYTAPP